MIGPNLIKSQNDKRKYRYVTLSNQLTVVLIEDEETEKSSACLDVGVGSMSNPKDIPGLAHFLEHMLFLGTEKYPIENAYSQYLNAHGGSSNAYTAQEVYYYYYYYLLLFIILFIIIYYYYYYYLLLLLLLFRIQFTILIFIMII